MVEVYKILHSVYESSVAPVLLCNKLVTKGNKYKLHCFHYDFRKFYS